MVYQHIVLVSYRELLIITCSPSLFENFISKMLRSGKMTTAWNSDTTGMDEDGYEYHDDYQSPDYYVIDHPYIFSDPNLSEHHIITNAISLMVVESNSLDIWELPRQQELRNLVSGLRQALQEPQEEKESILEKVLTKVPKFFPDWYIRNFMPDLEEEDSTLTEETHKEDWNYVEW